MSVPKKKTGCAGQITFLKIKKNWINDNGTSLFKCCCPVHEIENTQNVVKDNKCPENDF